MNSTILRLGLYLGLATSALTAHAAGPGKFRPFLGAGFTFGASLPATLQAAEFGNEGARKASTVQLYGGAQWQVTEDLVLQGSAGYRDDSPAGVEGGARVSRYPVDLLALVGVSHRLRLGGGVQMAASRTPQSRGLSNRDFDTSTGPVIESEYLISDRFSMKARFVSHTFKVKGSGASTHGKQFGLLTNWYF